MGKENTTISIDSEIKRRGKEILEVEGVKLSNWVEHCLRKLIKKRDEKEVENVQKE